MAFSFSKIPLLIYLTFVTLFATHYGLTFCLFMGTLYDTTLGPTLFLQTYTITQPDLMPKSLNELLRHWRSGLSLHLCSDKLQQLTYRIRLSCYRLPVSRGARSQRHVCYITSCPADVTTIQVSRLCPGTLRSGGIADIWGNIIRICRE